MSELLTIGEISRRSGVASSALRFYEQQGLLPARRTANGYREYDETDVRLVREIRTLQEIGFNLEETRPFVDCLRSGHESGAQCPASIEAMRRKLADLDACIERLVAVRDRIGQELDAARGRA